MKKPCKVLLIGFGHVARRLCEILCERPRRYPQLSALDLQFVGLLSRRHGAWVAPQGIDLSIALENWNRCGRLPDDHAAATKISSQEAVESLDYDVLVELATLSIEGRGRPALDYVRAALRRGRHVVTANKGPATFAWEEIRQLASARGVQFRFESTVLDGTPVINLYEQCLSATQPQRIEGILNCTSNYVLARGLETGDWASAIRDAQKEGFAEADPSLDLLGWDSAAKLAILSNVYLGANLTPLDIPRDEVSPSMIESMRVRRRPGDHWRVICRAWREGTRVRARVELCNLPPEHPFRTLTPASAGIIVETDLTRPIFIGQQDPDLTDTAFGVLQDLWTIFSRPLSTKLGSP